MEPRLPIYILAGGRSSRFGSDKARAQIQGRSLLEHLADALEPHARTLKVIAAQAGAYDDLGFETLADARPGQGPLAGLERAMIDQRATIEPRERAMIDQRAMIEPRATIEPAQDEFPASDKPITQAAGDDPSTMLEAQTWLFLVSCDLYGLQPSWLQTLWRARQPGRPVAFRGEHWEPLIALYPVSLLEPLQLSLDGGIRSAWRFLEDCDAVALDLPDDWDLLHAINRREDLPNAR